ERLKINLPDLVPAQAGHQVQPLAKQAGTLLDEAALVYSGAVAHPAQEGPWERWIEELEVSGITQPADSIAGFQNALSSPIPRSSCSAFPLAVVVRIENPAGGIVDGKSLADVTGMRIQYHLRRRGKSPAQANEIQIVVTCTERV